MSAVREILRNDAYRGARAYDGVEKVRTAQATRSKRSKPAETWTVKEAAHPAIVCQDLWDRVRRKREHVAQVYQEHGMVQAQIPHTQSLLAGLLTCGVCGGHFIIRGGYLTKAGGTRATTAAARTPGGAPTSAPIASASPKPPSNGNSWRSC